MGDDVGVRVVDIRVGVGEIDLSVIIFGIGTNFPILSLKKAEILPLVKAIMMIKINPMNIRRMRLELIKLFSSIFKWPIIYY